MREVAAAGRFLVDMLRCIPEAFPQDVPDLGRLRVSRLVNAAYFHGVEPALYVALQRSLPAEHPAASTLRVSHGGQIARHLQLLFALQTLGPALDAADVPWVVVKGPVLAERYWRRPDLRRSTDLDIVVSRHRLPQALVALDAVGATPVDVNWTMILEQVRGEISFQLPSGTALDLHWHVINERELRPHFPFPITAMLDRRRIVSIGGGQSAPTGDACDTFLHVTCHCARSGAHQLSWLKDVQLTGLAAELDWDDVVVRARQYQIGLLVAITLRRASRLFGAIAPVGVLEALAGRQPWIALTSGFDRVQPVQSLPSRGLSGQAAYACTRADTWRSIRAVFGHLPSVVRSRRHRKSDPTENVLHVATGGSTAKRAFLEKVSKERDP